LVVEPPTSTVAIKWAVPELRVGTGGTNDDAIFYLSIYEPGIKEPIYQMPYLENTDAAGLYLNPIELGVAPGIYDIGIKTHQHLTKVVGRFELKAEGSMVNFTQTTTSMEYGQLRLVAGDVNGSIAEPGLMGDDVVNSVDLSVILDELDADDPTTRAQRSNFNQDTVVNSVDLSIMLKNLDSEGER
jgi:hypothetical protein